MNDIMLALMTDEDLYLKAAKNSLADYEARKPSLFHMNAETALNK